MEASIKNGDNDIILSGSVIVQDIKKPLIFNLTLPKKVLITFAVEFEIVDDIKDAKAITLDGGASNATNLKLKLPKDISLMHVIDTPLIDIDGSGSVYLAIAYTTSRDGEVKFDYTFTSSPEVLSSNEKIRKRNG